MGWEFRFFTKHSELWKIKTFVSCEKKLEIFCYEILFRENLDIFSKNCLSTNRTPFYQTKSKVFCKTSKRFAEKHKDCFFYKLREWLQKSMVRVEKQNSSTRNSTFRAQDLGFGARFWIQGFVFLVLCLWFWVWCLGFFGVFVMAVTCDSCCFGRNKTLT